MHYPSNRHCSFAGSSFQNLRTDVQNVVQAWVYMAFGVYASNNTS